VEPVVARGERARADERGRAPRRRACSARISPRRPSSVPATSSSGSRCRSRSWRISCIAGATSRWAPSARRARTAEDSVTIAELTAASPRCSARGRATPSCRATPRRSARSTWPSRAGALPSAETPCSR
jgi:hypothetical protein